MKIDLDQLEQIAEAADDAERFWYTAPKRDFDYVSFGPVDNYKDNNEGPKEIYRFVAKMSPGVVLELVRMARAGKRK